MYRLCEHSFAIEKADLAREERRKREKKGYVPTAHKMWWKLSCTCQRYVHIRDTYFPQKTQTHIEFENK
jgi:hypothetical protein